MKSVLGFALVVGWATLISGGILLGESNEVYRDCKGSTCLKFLVSDSAVRGPLASEAPSQNVEDPKMPELRPRAAEASARALPWASDAGFDEGSKAGKLVTEGRRKKKKAARTLIPLLILLSVKALTFITMVMVAFIKKMALGGALLLFIKTLYYKTDHTVGYEHVQHPYPQQQHHGHDYGKQYGGAVDYGQLQDSYRFYAQQVTSHAGLQPQVQRLIRDTGVHSSKQTQDVPKI